MKTQPKSMVMIMAEKLAVFFLKHPLVTNVYLFGSVAMWEDGNDVDLVIETSNNRLSDEFLRLTLREYQKLDKAPPVTKLQYSELKAFRNSIVHRLLTPSLDFKEHTKICWNNMWHRWNSFFNRKFYIAALRIEEKFFREDDLFLFPVGWQTSEYVKNVLPNWVSRRAFGKYRFHTTVCWQARRFNSETGAFDPRQTLDPEHEQIYKKLRAQERHSWVRNQNKLS